MRRKMLLTDYSLKGKIPKTLGNVFAEKSTGNTMFIVAVRYDTKTKGLTLWYARRWEQTVQDRIFNCIPPGLSLNVPVLSFEITDNFNGWRTKAHCANCPPETWGWLHEFFKNMFAVEYVRSFGRFTR